MPKAGSFDPGCINVSDPGYLASFNERSVDIVIIFNGKHGVLVVSSDPG
jgi:hypothetical protein